jgi:hypothetical protein
MASNEEEYKRLRKQLNPSIKGEKTDAILHSMATGASHLVNNIIGVNDSLYITTAVGRYLDARLGDYNVARPESVGLDDDIYRKLGIEIVNRKQVRDLVMQILETIYGEEFTRATMNSKELEPYALADGDTFIISYDDQAPVTVQFTTAQFANINAATAQEVADAITRSVRAQGRTGSAFAKNDGLGGYVVLMPETAGPSSSVKVLGGKAQNKLKFDKIRPTAALGNTQWTIQTVAGAGVRMTWTGGPNPFIGKVRKNDYVNVYGSGFNPANRGTFTVTKVQSGGIGQAYFEFENSNVVSETAVQGSVDGVLFFYPIKVTPTSKTNYALAFQTESRLLEIFLPAVTKVVRRNRIGSAHVQMSGPSLPPDQLGPYSFDTSKPYSIGGQECNLQQALDSSTNLVINVDDSSQFPDNVGNLVFGFGTSKEEGPVPYIARPSSNSLLLNPAYKFKFVHNTGTNISLISQNFPVIPNLDGSSYQFFATDVVNGRKYAEELIRMVAATGINLMIHILYPNPIGLEKWQDQGDLAPWKQVWE